MNALSYLMSGGPVMYILLPMSVVAISVGFERLFVLRQEKIHTERVLAVLRQNVKEKLDPKAVLAMVKESYISDSFIVNKILKLFVESELEGENLEYLIEAEAVLEEKKLKERMWILDTAITMAPLLGLLGTIIGIVASFHVMSVSGLGKPTQITGGVAEALIATATGLVIAIVSLGVSGKCKIPPKWEMKNPPSPRRRRDDTRGSPGRKKSYASFRNTFRKGGALGWQTTA